MTTPTHDELQAAFLAHRRKHGINATRKILLAHGGDKVDPTLESVPKGSWRGLIAELYETSLNSALDSIRKRAFVARLKAVP
jgi:hypothetical protein